MSGRKCWCRDAWKSNVRIRTSSEDNSLKILGLMPTGQAALVVFKACRSFKTPFSVTGISGMSCFFFLKRFERYSQSAESFIGTCICFGRTEWK